MKELSVSVLILAFLISGCASINNSVPETQTAGSETTIPESIESPAETAETENPSRPTNEEEENPFNPPLILFSAEIQDQFNNQLVGFSPFDVIFFLYGFVIGSVLGFFCLFFLDSLL